MGRAQGPPQRLTWVGPEVGVYKLLVVAIDGPSHAGPGLGNAQGPGDITTLYHVALQTQKRA